jgi:CelD/BcsL family acetyltransferase involved in cellulose biosynthesis
LRLTLLREIQEDENLRREWNRLVQATEQPQVFYTYEWALAVQRAYGASVKPLIMLGYEGESLVGLAALAIDECQRKAVFLSSTTADYCDFLGEREQRESFVGAVFTALGQMQIEKLVLANMPADSTTVSCIETLGPKYGFRLLIRPAYACAQLAFGSAQQRMEVERTLIRKKMLRRNLNGLERQGPVRLNHIREWNQIRTVLPLFSNMHVARFLSTGRISNLVSAERRLFLEELARLLSQSGWLVLTELMVGDLPVAWNYGFQFCGTWFWYHPTFDSGLEKHSPGLCLLGKMIEEACERDDISVFDLGLGDEGYKNQFTTQTRQTVHLTATASFSRHIHEVARYRTAQLAKVSRSVEHSLRRVRSGLNAAAAGLRKSGVVGMSALSIQRLSRSCFGREKVCFYDWPATMSPNWTVVAPYVALKRIDLELLAIAAMEYADDTETLQYLLRCAKRLRSGEQQGFALVTSSDTPVHLCWVTRFEGFHMAELNRKLAAPSPNSVLVFDCWTPNSARGKAFYATTIQLVAARLLREGKTAWIFSAASNSASLRGIEKAGYRRRYSLIRRKLLLWEKVQTHEVAEMPVAPIETSVGA